MIVEVSDPFKTSPTDPPYREPMTLTCNVVGLAVSDMPASLAFYRGLGLDIPASADTESHVEVVLGSVKLCFDTEDVMTSFDPGFHPASGGSSRGSLAFEAGSPAEVDAAYAAMTGAGHHGHLEPFDAVWGQRYAVLHDPDGTTVDLYA